MRKKSFFVLSFSLTLLILTSCSMALKQGGPIIQNKLNDGSYHGEFSHGPNKAKVQVTIQDQKITNIELLMHDAWKGKKAEEKVIIDIIQNQSTDVDAVSGATNSSHVIMNAVEMAIQKAY